MRQVALAAAALGLGGLSGFHTYGPKALRSSWPDVDYLPTEPKPLTKRQRRRLRGKGKP